MNYLNYLKCNAARARRKPPNVDFMNGNMNIIWNMNMYSV